jgi:HK97 family phage portal protein
MKRVTLFDGATIKSKDLSNWTADEYYSVFGSYFGSDETTPRSLYAAVGWLYACVNLRSDRVASLPWAVFQGENQLFNNDEDLAAYPYLDNFSDLLELTEMALCLCGYAYWFKQRNARNMPLMMRWFAPDTMEPLYDPTVGIAGFRRHQGNAINPFPASQSASRTYSPDDIVYFKLPNAFSELEPGTPPAQAAFADAQVLHHMSDFTSAFFGRGAIKATVLRVDPNMMDDQVQKVEAWWKRFFSGIKNAWSTATIRSDALEAVVVGEGLESLTNSDLTLERRQSIATALGVPHSIVAADAANFATAQQDEINFLTNCIIPEGRLIQSTLNRQIFTPVGLRFQFEPERLSAMQEDEEQRATAYSLYVSAQMRPSIAAQLVGLNLPDGVSFDDLDADLEANQQLQREQAQAQIARLAEPRQITGPTANEQPQDNQQRADEVRRLKRWAKGKKAPDVDKFDSQLLSRDEKVAALEEAAVVEDAPFQVPYP